MGGYVKIPDTIQTLIGDRYSQLKETIDNAERVEDIKSEINDFLTFVPGEVKKFFEYDYAGNVIKGLISDGSLMNKSVHSVDFEYAMNQFKAFHAGMLKHLEENKDKDINDPETMESLSQVINNIFGFLAATFDINDCAKNPVKATSVSNALSAANLLILLKDQLSEYGNITYTGTCFDKMVALSIVAFAYYASVNMMNQLSKINDEVYGQGPVAVESVKYRML